MNIQEALREIAKQIHDAEHITLDLAEVLLLLADKIDELTAK